MQRLLTVLSAFLMPLVVFAEEAAEKQPESEMWSWEWIWANIQSLDSLVALLVVGLGGVAFFWKFLRKQPEQAQALAVVLPPITTNELEQHYYTHLAEQCQRYDLGGFRDSQSVSERNTIAVSLSDVYVDLLAHEVKPLTDVNGKQEAHAEMRESRLLLDVLQETALNRLVIRGDVGSGKSSFINYLCYSIIESRQARETSPKVPDHWLRRPVVRVLLREVGGQICPATDLESQVLSFVRQRMEAHIKNRYPADTTVLDALWREFLANFEHIGVLVLDGLDEVSNSHEKPEEQTRRQILLDAVQRFACDPKRQGMAIIITSRNHAYGGDDALAGFRLLQLDPLNNSDRYQVFIRHWYQRVAYTAEEKLSNQADAQRLLNNLAKRDSLRPLTETPLLLTLILVLDKAKIGLPESRADLYRNAVDLLLERWNKQLMPYESSLSLEERQALEVLKLDANILLDAMKALAYQTYHDAEGKGQSNQETIVFTVETVEKALKEQLQQHTGLGFAHQDGCRHFLRFRSQILSAVGDAGISFVHKSFHEYLTAAYIMQRDMSRDFELWEMVATASKRDWWREVFLFAMNIGKAEYVIGLMKKQILSRQVVALSTEKLDEHLGSLSLFSDAALENSLEKLVSRSGERNPILREAYDDLQTHIRLLWEDNRLTIPQRAQLGRIWGRCGDSREGLTFQRAGYAIRYYATATRSFPLPAFDWQKIEAGGFLMGTEGDEGYLQEKPAQRIRFDQPFYISRAAVTNAQYQAFMDAGGYEDDSLWQALPAAAQAWRHGEMVGMELLESFPKEHREAYRNWLQSDRIRNQPRFWQDNRWNIANHPVVGVSWFEALAYAEWLNRNQALVLPDTLLGQGFKIRLPSEDEWEYAARGKDSQRYTCGDRVTPEQANYADTKLERTSCAGVFKAGESGLYDMTGNVWDWTSSRWGADFGKCDFAYGDEYWANKSEQNRLDNMEYRIVRGGSWYDSTDDVRCAIRSRYLPDDRYLNLGFRVVLGE
ncbi:MAG: SUMF1/EgtB/PvdO family nonheme iron enzyme [Candidatus Thiothrix moscowensis]|nr:SUMF1/EgtB/PvdO family nonheme iron enzyme [Candidatus Thiothrix moscowensis]